MALITSTTKKKPMTLLSTDLAGLVRFDSKQTLPASDITSEKYDAGMNLYLKTLGALNIDNEYNDAVKKLELQLEEAELSAKLEASLMSDMQANAAIEAQPGLGTGAAAIASQDRQKATEAVYEDIERGIAESYQAGIQSIGEEYQAALESILGEYDAATGTFSGLANYETMSNEATVAMAKVIASMIDPKVDTYGDAYLDVLKKSGYVEEISPNGEVVMTELGRQMFDALLNGVNVNTPQLVLGGKTLQYALAEQMAKSQYSGEEHWLLLSESKREELITQYASWLHNNQDALRITAWDLYTPTEDGYILDTEYSENLPEPITGVDGESGVSVLTLALDNVSDCTQNEFSQIKAKLISGEISDGSYFTFQSGKAYKGDKFYYIENGVVYKTEYTVDNPPPVINARQATIYSFGRFFGTGQDGHQDKWAQDVIDAANAGRIPEGTYINFNYNASKTDHETGWYVYLDGAFKAVSSKTKVEHVTSAGETRFFTLREMMDIGIQDKVMYYMAGKRSSKYIYDW